MRRIIILGGGIAGLSAAWQLARSNSGEIVLIERESLLCTHASGRNAAIFRPLEAEASLAMLARRSLALFGELSPERPLVEPRGLLLLARAPETLAPIAQTAGAQGTPHEIETPERVTMRLSGLNVSGWHGLYAASGGVIDIHALSEILGRASRALGVGIRCGGRARGVKTNDARVVGIEMADGELVAADDVVVAAGAWSGEVGESAGFALPLTPVRRHLALLECQRALPASAPAVWSLDDEVYFRREGQRVLTSPCDETLWRAGAPQAEVQCLEPLARKLGGIDAALGRAEVVRYWACLRTYAPDRRPVIGSDPRVEGLHWLAGLGGFGMTSGVAAGELLAQSLSGRPPPSELAVQRLLTRP
ncbi:MAG TPA: FAD-dependent oxidoreductase [Polyangiaceae bacterium]